MYGVATQNGVGVSLGNIPALTSLAYPQMLNAIVLGAFSSGAPGWLYDDTNQSTLYQDAAGTTPVTALEQPVGLQLDLSQGLVQGADLVTPVANRTFTSDTGFWSKDAGVTISGNAANWPGLANGYALAKSGFLAAGKTYLITVTVSSVTGGGLKFYAPAGVGTFPTYSAAGTYTAIVTASSISSFGMISVGTTTASITYLSAIPLAGNHRYQPTSANRLTWSARYNLLLATASLSTQSVTVGAGSYTLYFTGAGSVTLSGAATGTKTAGSNAFTCTAGTLTLTVTGSVLTADLRPTDQFVYLPQYQAVVTASNYDSVGFPAGLRWNGSNSWMQNASVDFSGTNKVSLVVGVRKASDASAGMVCELSATSVSNNGTFALTAPDGGTPTYDFYSTGTVAKFASTSGFAAPITNTVTGLGDIAAPLAEIRVNGVVKTSTTTTQGTGNFGNYAAYFGARGGSSLFFNGLTFSNIAIGIELSASQIAAFEAWTNARARAYV